MMAAGWPPPAVRVGGVEELRERVRDRRPGEPAFLPRGSGTLLGRGSPPAGACQALDLRGLRRVVDHAAADLTITVEAGLALEELQEVLLRKHQWLPCAFPAVPGATVGGMIAADRRSVLAGGCGTTRDFLLGMTWVDGEGALIRAGAKVVKSVAGYDLMKLFTGSLGEYGAIVEATFKVLPRPETWGAVEVAEVPSSLVAAVLREGTRSWFASGLWMVVEGGRPGLLALFTGARDRVQRQCATAHAFLGSEARILGPQEALHRVTRLQEWGCGATGFGWGGVLPSHAVASGFPEAAGNWLVDLHAGNLRWDCPASLPESELTAARAWARAGEGQLHLDAAPGAPPRSDAWGRDPGSVAGVLRRLKAALDPGSTWVGGRHPGGV